MKKKITLELLFSATRSFIDGLKKGKSGTVDWKNITVQLESYEIPEDSLTPTKSAHIGYVTVPARRIKLDVIMKVETKAKKGKKRNT